VPNADPIARVDRIVRTALAKTGVPSVSLAVVEDGRLMYTQAYGTARQKPRLEARPDLPYSIGSISKQFTAAAILLLQEEHRLSLADKVGKWLPELTRANDITVRQVLSMTSGYQDYAPQDYMVPEWSRPISPDEILTRWAKKPLDFEPGTQWQYSNTNYVIAGLIVEKLSGEPLMEFLRRRFFSPLGIGTVYDSNFAALPETDPQGYFRRGLGLLRPAPHEGTGWMYAAGELAMTAADLAKWDISVLRRSLLSPDSYAQMQTEVLLASGAGVHYGLGVGVSLTDGHRQIEHSGEVSGFTAENILLPEDNFAVVVLTNQDATSAANAIATQIRDDFLKTAQGADPSQDALVRRVFDQLRSGNIDRSLFTANCNAYFSAQALSDYAHGMADSGEPQSFEFIKRQRRGGMLHSVYQAKFSHQTLLLNLYQVADNKFEQFLVEAKE